MIKLRIDDFPCGMPGYRYRPDLLRRIDDLGVAYVLGIVPFSLTPNDMDVLEHLKHATWAVHGFDHGFSKWRPQSEFDGMSQKDMIHNMNEIIPNVLHRWPNWFIPPFNRFNQDLLDVLNEYPCFEYITGGPESYSQQDSNSMHFGNLQFIPSMPPYYTSNGSFRQAIKMLETVPDGHQVTIHLCDQYD